MESTAADVPAATVTWTPSHTCRNVRQDTTNRPLWYLQQSTCRENTEYLQLRVSPLHHSFVSKICCYSVGLHWGGCEDNTKHPHTATMGKRPDLYLETDILVRYICCYLKIIWGFLIKIYRPFGFFKVLLTPNITGFKKVKRRMQAPVKPGF